MKTAFLFLIFNLSDMSGALRIFSFVKGNTVTKGQQFYANSTKSQTIENGLSERKNTIILHITVIPPLHNVFNWFGVKKGSMYGKTL